MESGRKRRLGSVNTGSGSDTEMEERMGEMEEEGMEKHYQMRERGEEREMKVEEKSEMEVDLPEVSDDTPVSLLNLAILARKVQRTILSSERSNYSALSRVITS